MSNLTEVTQWAANVNQVDDLEYLTEALLNASPQSLADRTQWLKARLFCYAADTSNTPNSIVIAPSPVFTAHPTGLPIHFLANTTNTGNSVTVTINSLAAVPVTLPGGSMEYGNIRRGGVYTLLYNPSAGAYTILNPSERVGLLRMELAVPYGYLRRDGSLQSRSTFADLFGWATAKNLVVSEASWAAGYRGLFSVGNGSTNFRLPDFGDWFERGLAASGRAVGSEQADEFKSHTHQLAIITGTGLYAESGDPSGGSTIAPTPTFPAGGTETRPKNIALIPVIKY